MRHPLAFTVSFVLIAGGLLSFRAFTSPPATAAATVAFLQLEQPLTVSPPTQPDNGEQVYWGMCADCHGDVGQGLTEEWRASFVPEYRDCWQSGCHGADHPDNSFELPQTGVPGLAGAGKLARFSNAFELEQHIFLNMPFSRSGSLQPRDAWSLTVHLLKMNKRQPEGLTLDEKNSAAIPIHRDVSLPDSEVPGTLALAVVLLAASAGLGWRLTRDPRPVTGKPNFLHHLHPPAIPAEQARFRYTLGAGGLAVFFCLVLLVTGLLEMYYYIPDPAKAAASVQTITTLVPFGRLVRNLHYWSAQFLVITSTVHLLRVTLTGSYSKPRRFNYLLGLGLLVILLLLDFTGYVLRWDEGIRWALVVGTNLLKTIPGIGEGVYRFAVGGTQPGSATLTRFYAWHIFGLTLAAGILVAWHIFRIRRDGGIAAPTGQPAKSQRISRFELLRLEGYAMAVAGVVLLLFALAVPAPIQQPIVDMSAMTGDSTAPWFFLWVQQLLKLGDPFVWGVLIPALVVVALGLVPYALPGAKSEEQGRWLPRGNRLAQVVTAALLLAILLLTLLGAAGR